MKDQVRQLDKLWEPLKALVVQPRNPLHLQALTASTHALTESTTQAGQHRAAHLSMALEALLGDLSKVPQRITPPILLTVAQAVDTLKFLLDQTDDLLVEQNFRYRVLVVDDDLFARRAVKQTLKRAGLRVTCLDAADKIAEQNEADKCHLILLDIEMPGINGFDLCSRLRDQAQYRRVPIIFLTLHDGYEYRTESTIRGADDFITKPFLPTELVVKALSFTLRGSGNFGSAVDSAAFSRRDLNALKQRLLGSLTGRAS